MKPTPLPKPAVPKSDLILGQGVFGALYTTDQMHSYAAAVNADLRAEIERLWAPLLRMAAKDAIAALKEIKS
jgi:hypothetical protein